MDKILKWIYGNNIIKFNQKDNHLKGINKNRQKSDEKDMNPNDYNYMVNINNFSREKKKNKSDKR